MLNKGDTIGIIALSGNCEQEKVYAAETNLENLGYKVKLSKNIFSQNRYLAGKDEEKIKELHNFYADDGIKVILCARGGYGAIRLIKDIDYNIIQSNPKVFCGFSDVTALLLMIYKKTEIITYHSPMACTDFISNNSKTLKNFFETINGKPFSYKGTKTYQSGQAEGILWGGNLSTIVSLCGQDFLPNKDFIFFTEDLNEPVYKIDKMFQQLINIPQFLKFCKGIVLGDFLGVDNEKWIDEYFIEMTSQLSLPCASGFKITHSQEKITLPIGKTAKLDGKILIAD